MKTIRPVKIDPAGQPPLPDWMEDIVTPRRCPGCDQTDEEAKESSVGHCRMCESVPTRKPAGGR